MQYLTFVRGTDLFSLILSNKKMTTANTTIVILCEWIKIIPILGGQIGKKFFLVCCRILVISLGVPSDGRGWRPLPWVIRAFGVWIPHGGFLKKGFHPVIRMSFFDRNPDFKCKTVCWIQPRSSRVASPVVIPAHVESVLASQAPV